MLTHTSRVICIWRRRDSMKICMPSVDEDWGWIRIQTALKAFLCSVCSIGLTLMLIKLIFLINLTWIIMNINSDWITTTSQLEIFFSHWWNICKAVFRRKGKRFIFRWVDIIVEISTAACEICCEKLVRKQTLSSGAERYITSLSLTFS